MPAFVALAPKDAAAEHTQPVVDELQPALPFRADTMLGVCEGIGQDLGFNPTYLRVIFASLFYFDPAIVVGSYLALGAGLALARWLYPVSASPVVQTAAEPAAPAADNEDSERSLAA
jgi:phage shock protein C